VPRLEYEAESKNTSLQGWWLIKELSWKTAWIFFNVVYHLNNKEKILSPVLHDGQQWVFRTSP
jgi:hypothetical protein